MCAKYGKNISLQCNFMEANGNKMAKTLLIKIIIFHLFINLYIKIIIEE